jgi:hypothetical protein
MPRSLMRDRGPRPSEPARPSRDPRAARRRASGERRCAPWLVAMLAASACGPAPTTERVLEVYVRSDLAEPELREATVELELLHATAGTSNESVPAAALDLAALRTESGAFVARLLEVAPGQARVAVRILAPEGRVYEGERLAAIDADAVVIQVRVLITRDVIDCDPAQLGTASDPCTAPCSVGTCEGGRCFVVRTAEWFPGCECDTSRECADGAAGECSRGECQGHVCQPRAEDSLCPPGRSCVEDADGFACARPSCRGLAPGTPCPGRSVDDPCDPPELCDGVSDECPADEAVVPGGSCVGPGGAGFCRRLDPTVPGSCLGGACTCDTECRPNERCDAELPETDACYEGRRDCGTEGWPCVRGALREDRAACGEATECTEAPTCQGGVCVPGAARVGGCTLAPGTGGACVLAECGPEGGCGVPAPAGTSCGSPPRRCTRYRCDGAGTCELAYDGDDPRCETRSGCERRACKPADDVIGECVTTGLDDAACRPTEPCRVGQCAAGVGCTFLTAPDGTACACTERASGTCTSGSCVCLLPGL